MLHTKTDQKKPDDAAPDDMRFLLRGLDATPLQFRVKSGASAPPDAADSGIVAYLQSHGGATIQEIISGVPALAGVEYNRVRSRVARLLKSGVLEICGQVSLEAVDDRYERVPACDLCGLSSDGQPIVLWKYNTPVVRCSGCGLLYANPRWKSEHLFGRYTDDYWSHYAELIHDAAIDVGPNAERWKPHLDYLELARENGRLLDIGCANGDFLLEAKARGWEVYGVETSPMAAAQARATTGAPIHTGTLDTAPFSPGFFDAITMWDVIEHVPSPRAYLTMVASFLRPGGMVSMTTPNIRSVSYRVLGRRWWVVGPNDHIYYFSPATMQRLLTTCGFTASDIRTWGLEQATVEAALGRVGLGQLAPRLHLRAILLAQRLQLGDALYLVARKG